MGTETIPVDLPYLNNLLQRVLESPALSIREWSAQPLQGGLELGSAIYRVRGLAEQSGSELAWSLILKVIRPDPEQADPQGYRYWRREPDAYQSGHLHQLPAPVTAPRCYDVCQQADGSLWLWLEDIQEDQPAEWSIEQYAQVARGLGRFNGAFLAGKAELSDAWLVHDWLRRYVEHAAPMVAFIRQNPAHPAVKSLLPGATLALSLAMWDERQRMERMLDRQPQSFCHQDAFRRNLFRRGQELVAIDWGYAGMAPVGAELAPLIGVAFGLAGFPSNRAKELDQACFEGYLQGLEEVGWNPDRGQVRLGYVLTVLLRYVMGGTMGELLPGVLEESTRQRWADGLGKTTEKVAETDAGIAAYYQSITFEAMQRLGLGAILRLVVRTVFYSIRLRQVSAARQSG